MKDAFSLGIPRVLVKRSRNGVFSFFHHFYLTLALEKKSFQRFFSFHLLIEFHFALETILGEVRIHSIQILISLFPFFRGSR